MFSPIRGGGLSVAEQKTALDTALEQVKVGKFQASPTLPENLVYACEVLNQVAQTAFSREKKITRHVAEGFLAKLFELAAGRVSNNRIDKVFAELLWAGYLNTMNYVEAFGVNNTLLGNAQVITLFLLNYNSPNYLDKELYCGEKGAEALTVILKEQPYLFPYFKGVKIHLAEMTGENLPLLLPQLKPIIDHIESLRFDRQVYVEPHKRITKDSIQCIEQLLEARTNRIVFQLGMCADAETKRVLMDKISKRGGEIVMDWYNEMSTLFPRHSIEDGKVITAKLTKSGQVELNYKEQSKIFDIDDPDLNALHLKWKRM